MNLRKHTHTRGCVSVCIASMRLCVKTGSSQETGDTSGGQHPLPAQKHTEVHEPLSYRASPDFLLGGISTLLPSQAGGFMFADPKASEAYLAFRIPTGVGGNRFCAVQIDHFNKTPTSQLLSSDSARVTSRVSLVRTNVISLGKIF